MGAGGATMTTTRRNLRAPDVQDLTGCTYRQLDYWCRTYAICPEGQGTGTTRLFTITEARVVRALVLAGEHGLAVGTYARAIHAALHALPDAQYLVLAGDAASAHRTLPTALGYVERSPFAVATVVPVRLAR